MHKHPNLKFKEEQKVNFIEDTPKLNKNNLNLKEVKTRMKRTMDLGFLALMVAALAFAFGHSAMAFHQASELVCMACHTMHASENGSATGVIPANGFAAAPAGGVTPGGNPKLLLQSGVTDLCLACHSESGSASTFADPSGDLPPHVMSASGSQAIALPGGDYWSSNQTHAGDAGAGGRGHNPYYSSATIQSAVILPDGNLADDRLPPGSSTTLTKWDCGACHAPHHGDESILYGTAAPFRLLWSKPAGQGITDVEFVAQGADVTADEADDNHTAYQDNTSAWCGQCHGTFHSDAGNGLIHPSDDGLDGSSVIYALYNGNPSPDPTAAYSYLVPIERTTATTGDFDAVSNDLVVCMSCHRAHGASTNASLPAENRDARNITRWDMETASGSGTGCNKCHDKGD
jgi:hypothetical protein